MLEAATAEVGGSTAGWVDVLTLLVAILSAAFSGWVAYNQHQAKRRKPLVTELRIVPMDTWPGRYSCEYTVRNLEPVTGLVVSVTSRKRSVLLLALEDGEIDNGMGSAHPKAEFATDLARRTIEFNREVAPVTEAPTRYGQGPVVYVRFYASGKVGRGDIEIKTAWADRC